MGAERRSRRRRPGLIGAVLGVCLVAAAAAAQEQEPLVIRALGNQYGFADPDDETRLVWVFLGGVEVERGDMLLLGDKLVVVLQRDAEDGGAPPADATGQMIVPGSRILEFSLEGDVSVDEVDASIVDARAIYADNLSGEMLVERGTWRAKTGSDVVYVRFESMRRMGDGTRELTGVQASTCSSCDPDWAFNAARATLQDTADGTVLHTSGNTLEIGGLPLFWLPGVHFNVDKDRPPLRSVTIGTSSRFGTEVRTVWGGDADEGLSRVAGALGSEEAFSGDWQFSLDNYSARGVFYEPQWTYRSESSQGKLFGSYIRDRAKQDFTADTGIFLDDKSRGRVDLEHRTNIDESRVIDVELSYLSDPGYLREYYESESRIGKEQETYVNYRDVEDNRAISILARARLNDFQTQIESLPRVEARLAGERLDAGPFGKPVLTTVNFADAVRRAPGEAPPEFRRVGNPPVDVLTPVTQEDSRRNTRVGSRSLLTWPFDTESGDRIRLTAGFDVTAFEDTIESPDDPTTGNVDETVVGDGDVRYALFGGAEWSRTYSGVGEAQSDTWNFDGVRQIVEPRAGFRSVLELNRRPESLVQIDQTEQLDKDERFELGFRHRIQTHQKGGVATVLDTDISIPFFPNEDRDNELVDFDNDRVDDDGDGDVTDFPETIPGRGRTSGNILVDTRWSPGADYLALQRALVRWRAEIDPNTWEYIRSSLSYQTEIGDRATFQIAENKAIHVANTITAGMQYELTNRWTAAVFAQQDNRRDELARLGFVVRQTAECWVMDVEVSQRNSNRAGSPSGTIQQQSRDETRVSLRFMPRVGGDRDDESLLSSLGRVRAR